MSIKYSSHFQTKQTPQDQKIPGSNQIENSAGGFVFGVDDWKRLDRFLVLGSEGGSYYASEKKLTIENAEAVTRCIDSDGVRMVKRIVEISQASRAPKNDPALFALAMAAGRGNLATKHAAFDALPQVARTGTHLFTFLEYVQGFRGWGRGLRGAVGRWYNDKFIDQLAYQVVKYRQRNGWSHRDALRLAHPIPQNEYHADLYRWITKATETTNLVLPQLVQDFIKLQKIKNKKEVIRLLQSNPGLTWEMIPTEFLGFPEIWEALLPAIPLTAMIRNLARMTANGLIQPMNDATRRIVETLTDQDYIQKSRLHPISILGALMTYQQGHGAKGQLSWEPVREIVDALDQAFYLSFGNVTPTGKRCLLALDVSGSMDGGQIGGMPGLTPRIASAALSLITANVERQYRIVGFSHELTALSVSPRQRLDNVIQTISRVPMGRTDCALPMIWAKRNKVGVDLFVIYTDNETWFGQIHPVQALKEYRQDSGIPAKLVVVGMVANNFSIADPNDVGMLDVVGFDITTPELISDFARS